MIRSKLSIRSLFSRRIGLAPLAIALVAGCGGCTTMQTAVNGISHWQENRADCAPVDTPTGNNDCEQPCVALEQTQGYLSQGPTFGGEQIMGPPSPSAVERMLELTKEVDALRAEKRDLEQQLGVAEETIRQQGMAIDAASQELQRALGDYNRMREHLVQWQDDVRELEQKHLTSERNREQILSQFETDLQDILAHSETRTLTQSTAAPSSTTTTREAAQEPATRPADPDGEAKDVTADDDAESEQEDVGVPPQDHEMPLPSDEADAPVLNAPVLGRRATIDGQKAMFWLSDVHEPQPVIANLAPVVDEREVGAVSLSPPSNRRPINR